MFTAQQTAQLTAHGFTPNGDIDPHGMAFDRGTRRVDIYPQPTGTVMVCLTVDTGKVGGAVFCRPVRHATFDAAIAAAAVLVAHTA